MARFIAIKYVASVPGVHTSIDSREESAIIVVYHNHIIRFQERNYGLYYYDTANKSTSHIKSYSFLITVK